MRWEQGKLLYYFEAMERARLDAKEVTTYIFFLGDLLG